MRAKRLPGGAILWTLALAILTGGLVPACKAERGRDPSPRLPAGVPAKVLKVLKYVDEHQSAPPGYVGGITFENREKKLPKKTSQGKPIRYQEWDVNRKERNKNRGPERLVTGSDGSAYYTKDHYRTFKKIR
jgi:guanyl-specific ribonuclease Sa